MTTTVTPVVALCMPIANKIDPQFFRSFRFLDRDGLGWHHFDMTGWPVEVARNEITAAVLRDAPEVTHLLWIDDDMVFPAHALKRLLGHDLPFVGGLCFDRRHPYKPVIARLFDKSWGFDPYTLGWLFDYPADTLLDVDATGGAFLLVKTDVFRAIREKEIREEAGRTGDLTEENLTRLRAAYKRWWTPLPWQGASEDLSFCQRVREVGVRLKVDTGLKIGHVGEVVVDEAFAKRNRTFEYHRWHPPLDALLDAARTRPRDEASQGVRDLDSPSSAPGAPVASVVIPVYNQRPDVLRAAVKSALAQTVPVEVIVVDDGSSSFVEDALVGLIGEDEVQVGAQLRVVRHGSNRGIGAALNTGIAYMTTDWFAWLSSDDFYEPDKIERHLAALLSAGAKCGYTGYNLKFDNGNSIGHVPTLIFPTIADQMHLLGRTCAINGSTVMIHRDVFAAVGLFDPSYRYGQDWEFWCRAGEKFLWHGLLDKLTTRREFGNLTAMLAKREDPAKTARRDAEDQMIRERYGKGCPTCGRA